MERGVVGGCCGGGGADTIGGWADGRIDEEEGHVVITSGCCMQFSQHCHVVVGSFVWDRPGADLWR